MRLKSSYDKSPLDGILDMTFPTDPNLRPKVKEEIEATVSQLPFRKMMRSSAISTTSPPSAAVRS